MNILMVHPHDIYSRREPWTRRIRCLAKEDGIANIVSMQKMENVIK